jgi:hypothetical protein
MIEKGATLNNVIAQETAKKEKMILHNPTAELMIPQRVEFHSRKMTFNDLQKDSDSVLATQSLLLRRHHAQLRCQQSTVTHFHMEVLHKHLPPPLLKLRLHSPFQMFHLTH